MKMEVRSDENVNDTMSESSNDSFFSACDSFGAYDNSCEPLANEIEVAEHARKVEEEEEEELMLLSRYAGETDLKDWYVLIYVCILNNFDQ